MAERLLIVEDETTLCESLKRVLGREGYEVDAVGTAEEGLARLDEAAYDALITDIILPGMDGIELMERARPRFADQVTIVMTAYATLDTAVRALRAGAYDYVIKPVIHEELRRVLRNGLLERSLRTENQLLARQIQERYDFERVVGESAPMRAILDEVAQVADSRSNVLLLGETGTGKELVARAIHARSARRDKPFVPINCSAIPADLIESELFGYQRGAFTGAVGAKRGLFEEADGGTVFLDEIGELSHHLQSKLLRVIDDREIRPLGAVQSRLVDIRFVAATNVDVRHGVSSGIFREDLYYRLSVVTLGLPPLRERTGDVPLLARHFLEKFAHEFGRPVGAIDAEALRILEACPWPGNVRELRNVVERAVLLADGPTLLPEHLPSTVRGEPAAKAAPRGGIAAWVPIEEYTRRVILEHQGSRSEQEIADMLGVSRKCLWEKRRRWNLPRSG
jgi:DNA-binding NtrC family response regulator